MTRPSASLRRWGKKIEAARTVADDRRLDLGHAVALLEMLGDHIASPRLCPDELECQDLGLRVEYLARQIARHTEELGKELEKIELAAMAMGRGDAVEADPTAAAKGGNVVYLNQPDGGAA